VETKANEKLADVYQHLLQAGVNRNESKCEARLNETLATLQCIFPGNTKPINNKFCSFARGACLAVDAIQYEYVGEHAMLHVCGNALVCDTMDVARYVCWE
ncbi:hypothetical protein F4604DRAFT_1495643, partial [Suillus subluteus]